MGGCTPPPHDRRVVVGTVRSADSTAIDKALDAAKRANADWDRLSGEGRAGILDRAADLFEADRAGLMALICREDEVGVFARRMLPAAILLPFGSGWFLTHTLKLGLVDIGFAISAMSLVLIVLMAGVGERRLPDRSWTP